MTAKGRATSKRPSRCWLSSAFSQGQLSRRVIFVFNLHLSAQGRPVGPKLANQVRARSAVATRHYLHSTLKLSWYTVCTPLALKVKCKVSCTR